MRGTMATPCHLVLLGYHRNLDLRGFALDRDGFLCLPEALDIAADGIFSHGSRVIQIFAFGDKSWERRNGNSVATTLVQLEKGGVLALVLPTFLHLFILEQNARVLSFREPGFVRGICFFRGQINSRFLTLRGGFGMTALWGFR
jgi:hypothetical protein